MVWDDIRHKKQNKTKTGHGGGRDKSTMVEKDLKARYEYVQDLGSNG